MTAIYYDTEFHDTGSAIDLISIGMVDERGAEYYAVSSEFDQDAVRYHQWLGAHVWNQLPLTGDGGLDTGDPAVKPRSEIMADVRRFVLSRQNPQLWAWYGAYDYVALCQLFGTMVQLPVSFPGWSNDLRQEYERLGRPQLPLQGPGQHNALADARWNRRVHLALQDRPYEV